MRRYRSNRGMSLWPSSINPTVHGVSQRVDGFVDLQTRTAGYLTPSHHLEHLTAVNKAQSDEEFVGIVPYLDSTQGVSFGSDIATAVNMVHHSISAAQAPCCHAKAAYI